MKQHEHSAAHTHNTLMRMFHLGWRNSRKRGRKGKHNMKMMLKHCQKKQEKKSHECTHSKKGFEHKSFIYLSLYAVNDSDNQKNDGGKKWK